jgi:hypothetical protein
MKLRNFAIFPVVLIGIAPGASIGNPSLAPTISSPDDADKTIIIHDTTNRVSVFTNETILFRIGTQQFAIKFDGVSREYNLVNLAPAGMLTHNVLVYVAPSPVERGQGVL